MNYYRKWEEPLTLIEGKDIMRASLRCGEVSIAELALLLQWKRQRVYSVLKTVAKHMGGKLKRVCKGVYEVIYE